MSSGNSDSEKAQDWDDFRPRSSELFLDTSIHVSRQKGPDFTGRITKVCSAFAWVGTSSYTKVEYGITILNACCYLLGKIERLGLERALDFVVNVLPQQHAGLRALSLNLLRCHYGCRGAAGLTVALSQV
jgi:hypothetical protein